MKILFLKLLLEMKPFCLENIENSMHCCMLLAIYSMYGLHAAQCNGTFYLMHSFSYDKKFILLLIRSKRCLLKSHRRSFNVIGSHEGNSMKNVKNVTLEKLFKSIAKTRKRHIPDAKVVIMLL